jgi:hypothetical protein
LTPALEQSSIFLVPSIHFHGRYLCATLNTPVAGIDTALHDRIILEQGAAFGTLFAGSSANTARRWMQCRSVQHEIGAEATEFGAVHHRANVFCFGVCAATVQAVLNGLQANVMAIGAVVDAIVHRLVHAGVNRIRFVVGHVLCLSKRNEIARLERRTIRS